MKKILLGLGAVLILALAVNLITNLLENEVKDEYYDVMMSVQQIKSDLPLNTGNGMTLTDVNLAGKLITYKYKTDNDKKEMSEIDIENYKAQWIENTINTAKNNPLNKAFVKEDIKFQYFLVDKNDLPILNFEISPESYK